MAGDSLGPDTSSERDREPDTPSKKSEKDSPRKAFKRPSAKAAGKAKAKASSKAGAQKGKAKEPKSVMKTNMKKPAASGSMKKPAAAPVSTASGGKGSTSWREGIVRDAGKAEDKEVEEPEEEHVDFEEDPILDEGDVQDKRDRTKNAKFQVMLSNGQLPPFVQKEWERVCKMKVGKRERQTAIINAIFDRSAAGRLLLNTDKPIFETMRSDYQDTKRKKEIKTLPLILFCGKFRLSEEQVQEGVRKGQFIEVDDGNGKEYGWRQTTFAEIKGHKSETGYRMSEEGKKDTMQKYMEMAQCWKNGIQRPRSNSSGSTTLAICDVDSPLSPEEWDVASKQLQSVSAALDLLEKNAMKHMGAIDQNDDEPLYSVLQLVSLISVKFPCDVLFFPYLCSICGKRDMHHVQQGKKQFKKSDASRPRSHT